MERWLPVADYEGIYEVSDQGRVRSLDRTVPHGHTGTRRAAGKVLCPVIDSVGYPFVHLGRRPQRRVRIHVLVLETFVGPRPSGLHGLHRDDVKTNGRLSNLRWGTQSENIADGWVNTRRKRRDQGAKA
jgi:hypothetical protein